MPKSVSSSDGLLVFAILPIAAAIATIAIDNRPLAIRILHEIECLWDEIESPEDERGAWKNATKLLIAPYEGEGSTALSALCQAQGDPSTKLQNTLRILQASACSDISLEYAVYLQTHIALELCEPRGYPPVIELVEKYIYQYWTCAFANQRFAFRNPREIEYQIQRNASRCLDFRTRRLLGNVASSLGVHLLQHEKAWCWANVSET
jgi:hypothetical protein